MAKEFEGFLQLFPALGESGLEVLAIACEGVLVVLPLRDVEPLCKKAPAPPLFQHLH